MILIPGIAIGAIFWLWRRSRLRRARRQERSRRALPANEDDCESGYRQVVTNAQNIELHVSVRTLPVSQGVVVLLHSFVAHSGSFKEVVDALVQRHYSVVTYDMQGHGRSGTLEKARGDLRRFEHLVHDAEKIVHFARRMCRKTPVFVLGAGFGATVAIHLGLKLERCIQGLILCNPIVIPNLDNNPPSHVPPVLMALEKLMPDLRIPSSELHKDIDPFMTCSPTLRFFVQAHHGLLQLEKRLHQLKCPFLTLHGALDERTSSQNSKELFHRAKSTDRTIMIYNNMQSCLMGELPEDRSHVMSDILAWLDARTNLLMNTTNIYESKTSVVGTSTNEATKTSLTLPQQKLLALMSRNGL